METKSKEDKKVTFKVPNEVVTVKFVPRRRGMAAHVDDNHVISGGMLNNAVKTFYCPLQRARGIGNILADDEKEFLEKKTGLNLSVYGDFWKKFKVKLFKNNASNVFDLSDPTGFLSVRVLESYPNDIAHSWGARNDKITYQFAITRPGEEINETKVKLDAKKEAFKRFGKIEDNREMLLGVLKLITNQPISKESNLDWLQGKVQEHVDSDPNNFISIITDSSFETKILIKKAVEVGVIKKKGNKYETLDGLELCNPKEVPTFVNTIKYLDDDRNQEIRLLIEARVDNAK